jgi:hypothetical protein
MELSEQIRAVVAEAASRSGVVLAPAEPGGLVHGVPMAPFPARLRFDVESQVLWHDVVAAEVVPPVAVEAVVEDVPLPRPEVRLMVGEARWMVALSYPLPFARASTTEVTGLLSAGALYAAALCVALGGHLAKAWRATLAEHGFVPGEGFTHDPRDLLQRGRVVGWPSIGQ